MIRILVLYGSHEAPAIQDIYFNNPFRILEKRKRISFILSDIAKFRTQELEEYHLVIISRVFEKKALGIIDYCRSKNKKVLFFLDDDVLGFPAEYYLNHEPFYKNNETLILEILRSANGLIVSTDPMKATYQKYNPVIYVTPPCIQKSIIELDKTEKVKSQKFTIGYAGSFGHVIDFKFLEDALFKFYKKNADVNIEFMGCIPEVFGNLLDNSSVKLIHWTSNYEEYLKNMLSRNWDVAICPVLDSAYTRHKSNIKFLEYSAAGIPGIYSDIIIYNGDVKDGKTGYLAANNYSAWIKKIKHAYSNRNRLKHIGEKARNYVLDHYTDKQLADRWEQILGELMCGGLSKFRQDALIYYNKAKKIYKKSGVPGVTAKVASYTLYKGEKYVPVLSRVAYRADTPSKKANLALTYQKLEENFDKKIIKKQILFIVPWLSFGGGDMVNYYISNLLDKEKFTLHFITTEKSEHEWEYRFRKITKNIFHIREVFENAQFFWEYNNLILDYIRLAKIDIVLISNSAIGYNCIPPIKERFNHIKIIDILHGQGGANEGGGFPEYSNPYNSYLDKRITINNYLKKYMISKYGLNPSGFEVIHNCIDSDYFRKSEVKRNRIFQITYVGRLSYEKHPEKVIDIADLFAALEPAADFVLNIVGDGPMYEEIKIEIARKKIKNKIRLLGYKSDIKDILEGTDVLILCSEMEGLPIILLEAMSMSVPCIATQVGGIPELITNNHNGYLIEYGSGMEKLFTEKLSLLYRDKVLWSQLARHARETIEKQFSKTRMISKYAEILEKI